MNSEQKKRIRDIQRRKKQREMRRKRIMRLVLGIAALLIVVIAVFAVKGCNNAQNGALNAEVTVSPLPTMASNREIDSEFYADSCFIGNTFVTGLEEYDLVAGADYIGAEGLDVSDVLTDKPENSSVVYINELNSNKNYKKIFMMFGEEELSWEDNDEFVSEYTKVIDKAKKYQPDAEIYLVSVTPVSEEAEDTVGYTNKDIEKMNKSIKQLAKDEDVIYCDIFDVIANSRGYLSDSASEDGIHFEKSYYEKGLVYIQKNYTPEAIAEAAKNNNDDETEDEDSSSSSSSSSNKSSSSSSSGSSSSSSGSNKSSSSSSSSNNSSGSSSSSNKSSSSSSSSNSGSSSNKSSSSNSSSNGSSSSSSSSNSSGSNSGSSSSSGSNSGSSSSNNSSSSSSSSNNSSSSSSSGSSNSGSASTGGGAKEMDLDS